MQIESMVSGGALWFPNLTMPDPYYALPVLASAFLLATVEVLTSCLSIQWTLVYSGLL
jgi:hypothetical protein